MKKVLIIQTLVKQYRVSFFEQLDQALKSEGIQLRVAYGDPTEAERQKLDNVELSSEIGLKVQNYWFLNDKLLYQSLWTEIFKSDLVIVEQASRHILNYFLLLFSTLKLKKVAFWGHGWDRQAETPKFSEWIKLKTINKVDWWFAYTEGTAKYLKQCGVPKNIITVVQNSIDTEEFKQYLLNVTSEDLERVREKLKLKNTDKIGLFCGGLYANKHWKFLLESNHLIRQSIPEFKLLVLGDGPDRQQVIQTVNQHPEVLYLGSKFGYEKALYFRLSDVFLIPGLVGLAILDAFVAGVPVVTTDIPIHSPEIEYLIPEINGFVTEHNQQEYAHKVINLLLDEQGLTQLKSGALDSSKHYNVETMVNNFKEGILKALLK
ncbi:glycosyltransferase family 4 protein [Lyngbya sp. PCC 8106]|uniref:glycosyltransferase family 4 protein n=1 Tax=Lyngbya sp. (strain PCC 8106) TaxID=313612 RepID=UPI0000EAC675|nr:glycosyltransferase family 4 protein [Lyngbya sp. PCC 8106]EAW38399.1 hypothetical protein L8106_06349 [Lyngbya sp. PCC 8106]